MDRQHTRIGAVVFFAVATMASAMSQPVTLTHQQHTIRDNRTQASEVVTGQATLSYPFERSALGEHFKGVLQVTLPETISGVASPNPNGFTIALNPPLTVRASMRMQYTTATFPRPEDQGTYRLAIDHSAYTPQLVECRRSTDYASVPQGTREISFSSECTFNSLHIACLGASCHTGFEPNTRFDVVTLVPGGFGSGPWYSVYSPYVLATPVTIDSIEPAVVSNDPSRPSSETTAVTIRGTDFVAGSTLSLGEGIQIANVVVKSANEIQAQIRGFGGAREGERDIEITRPNGTKQTAKGKFFVSSLATKIEVNQAVPTDCAVQTCIANHNTVVRVRLACNGNGCTNGKGAATGTLFVYKDGSLHGQPLRPDRAITVLAAGAEAAATTRSRGHDALNFAFRDSLALGEGTYEFVFEIDPRNVSAAPSGGFPDKRKNLSVGKSGQKFRNGNGDPLRIAVFVEGNAPADVSKALRSFEFLRAAYPLSSQNITYQYVPSNKGYSSVGDAFSFWVFTRCLNEINRTVQFPFTNLILFTRNSGMTEAGATRGMSNCQGRSGVISCRGNVSFVNIDHTDLEMTIAHEIGHTRLLGDEYVDETGADTPSFLNPKCPGWDTGCPVSEGSMNTINLTTSAVDTARPHLDGTVKRSIMGNAPGLDRWPTAAVWNWLYSLHGPRANANATLAAEPAATGNAMVVSGMLDRSDRVTNLLVQRGSIPVDGANQTDGGYSVEVQDGAGTRLDAKLFQPSFVLLHRGTREQTMFLVNLSESTSARRVVVKKGAAILATQNISANAPAVSFTAPSGGTLSGTVNVQWTASDGDGEPLTFALLYSPGGDNWLAIENGITGTAFAWNTSAYPGSNSGRLRLIASDGANETQATSAPFTIARKPAIVTITSPADGAAFAVGTPVTISGFAYDPQAGELSASTLAYTSNRAGALGTGRSVTVGNLAVGEHVITLTGTPSGGSAATTSIKVTIFTPAADLRVIPAVGSTAGSGGSFFKTAVQIHNPTDAAVAGKFVYHPGGQAGTSSDPSLSYMLLPHQTLAYEDLLPELGQSGLGSVDLIATHGAPPVSVVRIFNDAGNAGTTGMTEELFRESEALKAGESGVLLAPIDTAKARYNIGIRTLASGASIRMTLKNVQGAVRASVTHSYSATSFTQVAAAALLGIAPGAGEAIVMEILSGSAIVYGASTDNLTQDPSLQIARASSFYTGGGRRVLPVVGSAAGSLGSFFRTSVQFHNASSSTITGVVRFHPAGRSGTNADPSQPYTLPPGASLSTADVLQSMGQAGLGSLDIIPAGNVSPVSVVRIYNDAGAAGTTGLTEEQMTSADALTAGQSGVLVAPPDPKKTRFNLGVRTLDAGASLTLTLRSATGAIRKVVTPVFAPNFFQQTTAAQLLGETPLANETVTVRVDTGSAIVYASSTDNKTQDASLQIAKRR
ncbi:MAG TPA: hypothetical protein VGQ76_07015 [Thermoanaerobaculia bacterium]|jgi:hypothetical protein|nr:hypothetical protein [Thermoanaerobaculia bacterium]